LYRQMILLTVPVESGGSKCLLFSREGAAEVNREALKKVI